ncbi:MAG: hypothetical protein ACNA70_09545 [Brevefilum sp.]
MKTIRLIFLVFVFLLLAACAPAPIADLTPVPEIEPSPTEAPAPTPAPTETPPLTLEETANEVINALAARDLEKVAEFVHPMKGVRFSPYTYVEDDHLVFMPEDLPGLVGSDQVYLWGAYDGTGDPIELTFDGYYERFLYSADFANPEAMAVDEELGWSSMINNIAEFYPGASFVEYHFSGFNPDYGGMDWVSLRLVFIQEDGVWFLVGMVNDQWTI